MVGLNKGVGNKYKKFLKKFPFIVKNFTPSSNEECQDARFIHTAYLHDSVSIAVAALDGLVASKSREENTSPEDVQVTHLDRDLLAEHLRKTEVQDGFTGILSYTKEGQRKVASFAIVNFVPIENSNFSVSTAVVEDPWVLQTRALLKKEGGKVTFIFLTSDGEESNVSTIIFADGTSNIPPYRPFRIYHRGALS